MSLLQHYFNCHSQKQTFAQLFLIKKYYNRFPPFNNIVHSRNSGMIVSTYILLV